MPASCAHEHGSCTPHPLPNYQETFQLLRNPHEYDAPLVAEANISSGDTLDVVYTDGHVSEFSVSEIASELEGELVPVQVVEQEEVKPRLWNSTTLGGLPMVQFEHLHADDAERWRSLRHLLEEGILLVRGVPREEGQCIEMAEFLSVLRATEWGKVFNVRPIPDGNMKDLAYGSKAIGMHTDNAYRDPTPDYQLLHAITHCSCDGAEAGEEHRVVDGKNCSACTVFNTFTDGLYVAEKLSREARWAYDLLTTVPVRFENNGGDNSSFLHFTVPHLQLHSHVGLETAASCGAECVRSVRFSSKSGGFASPVDPAVLHDFYRVSTRVGSFAELS